MKASTGAKVKMRVRYWLRPEPGEDWETFLTRVRDSSYVVIDIRPGFDPERGQVGIFGRMRLWLNRRFGRARPEGGVLVGDTGDVGGHVE